MIAFPPTYLVKLQLLDNMRPIVKDYGMKKQSIERYDLQVQVHDTKKTLEAERKKAMAKDARLEKWKQLQQLRDERQIEIKWEEERQLQEKHHLLEEGSGSQLGEEIERKTKHKRKKDNKKKNKKKKKYELEAECGLETDNQIQQGVLGDFDDGEAKAPAIKKKKKKGKKAEKEGQGSRRKSCTQDERGGGKRLVASSRESS